MRRVKLRTARHVPGVPNKSEKMYMDLLDAQIASGEIIRWRFESLTFRLADKTTYCVDFIILYPDGHVECHETKGHSFREGRLKFKMAAELWPEFIWKYVKVKYVAGKPVVSHVEERR